MNGDELKYWSLQGTIDVMDRVAGEPMGGLWLGDCSSIEFTPNPTTETFKEHHSGNRNTGLSLYQGTEATLAITLHNISTDNMEFIFGGSKVAQDTDAVVSKTVTPATLLVGMTFLLGAYDLASVSLVDSTATPVTLVAGTHYELDAKTGRGRLLSITGLTGPIKASFTPGTVSYIKMLTDTEREKWIHITDKNTAVAGMPRMAFDFYLAKILPSSFQFINESQGEAVLNCNIVADPTKLVDGDLGQFGRAVML
ncbi:hypothetical protein CJ010_00850 [Azoarcus sp. DD4]|uniref:phage tail tube protein n=1 Tax=Azoarcus sp. DD4 TaxID=2027405 RepID=UPI0011266883|nr:hypothetical protein [Azoarcus sp. DD4]QDF95201.1 hypothetical protein CJ010_00850 [Azoarcus sp. DD4]